MVIRLGTNKFDSPQAESYQDRNETNEGIIKLGSNLRTNYQILKQVGSFENGDIQAVDRYTDSNGVNNTINTGSSSAVYDSINDYYLLNATDESSGDTTHDPYSYLNPENAFDGDDVTFAEKGTTNNNVFYYLGKTFTSKYVSILKIKHGGDAYSNSSDPEAWNYVSFIQTFDGSTWTTIQNIPTYTANISQSSLRTYNRTDTILINSTIQGIRIYQNINLASGTLSSPTKVKVFSFEYGDYDSSSTIIVDTSTITLDGTEKLAMYKSIGTIPTNTSKSVVISDGTNSTSSYTLDSYGNSEVIDISSLSSGTLKITETLETTDTEVTPTSEGYSIEILR